MARSMVATAVDLRDEMDETGGAALSPARSDAKAKFLIRTLPRECNPTPVAVQPSASANGNAAALSPRARKPSLSSGGAEVLVLEESAEAENPFDDITEEKLQQLTGKSDLARVTSLTIAVDSDKQSVEVIGELLTSLRQLHILPNSTLQSFRDLGTSLHSLQILNVANCGIKELDGIGALTELQELHLQYNAVSDISPLTMHDELQIVDLESNQVADVGQIEQLAFCPQLISLTLRGNPLCRIDHYRRIIASFLPNLETLDGKPVTEAERTSLPEGIVDAAIQQLKDTLEAESSALAAELRPRSARPESSHGRRMDEPVGLSRTPSSSRIEVTQDPSRDDYGSTLTHGSDIVFAGNFTSALRRHRSETEGGEGLSASAALASPDTRPMERPQTPARESITATLDQVSQLEKHKSRDAILRELKSWQLESPNVGVVLMEDPTQIISPATSPTKRPPSGHGRVRTAERRPNTSAGIVRNVREAFVEGARPDATDKTRSRDPPTVKRRSASSISSTVATLTVPTLSSRNVDILVLDEEPHHDDHLPCSPRKTSRGVFTTSTRAEVWNLDEIAPKLDLESTETFLQRSSRRTVFGDDDDADSASSGSDAEDIRTTALQLKQHKSSTKPPTHTKPKGFFNVTESLHAIDRWREQMDDDAVSLERRVHRKSHEPSPSEPSTTAAVEPNKEGLACRTSDDLIVQWMKEKHSNVAEIKTRDGFRRFFKGVDEPRLARILHRVFADGEKVRRRLQLMQGFYGTPDS